MINLTVPSPRKAAAYRDCPWERKPKNSCFGESDSLYRLYPSTVNFLPHESSKLKIEGKVTTHHTLLNPTIYQPQTISKHLCM